MALSSYSELLTSLETWLIRTDLTVVQLPDFIKLFEARFNRLVRVPQMEATSSSATTTGLVALPTDFLALRDLRVDDDRCEGMAPQAMRDMYQDVTAGAPAAYTLLANQIEIAPTPSSSVTVKITYYQKVPALTASNTTNWLLTAYPDAYLYGCLAIAGGFLRDDDASGLWKGAWDEVLSEIISDGNRRRLPAGPLVAKVTVPE